VNSGIHRSGRVLRRTLGLPDNTAAITDEVLRAVGKHDLRSLIAGVNDERLAFLKGLKTWPVFGAGWARRVAEVRAAALGMADVAAKAKAPSTKLQNTTTGAIATGGIVAAQQAHSAGASPEVIATIIIVTIVLALGGWFAWRWHQRRQQLARNN
jgi:lysozyme family protein